MAVVVAVILFTGGSISAIGQMFRGERETSVSSGDPILGAYTGVANKGVVGLQRWESWSGRAAPLALDFAADDSWANIAGPGWLLGPWRDANRQLIYSVPLFPRRETDTSDRRPTLRECAAGNSDAAWEKLGRQLVSYGLTRTIVRPGWEFNGSWYNWSARGQADAYIECFRRLVLVLRRTPGQDFTFLWNVSNGTVEFPASEAYPGDGFVDYIGVDVYDTSWRAGTYPIAVDATAAERRSIIEGVWDNHLNGSYGLRFWAKFSAAHDKLMAIPEWGLSSRPDGHGGGDNPYFIERMLEFIHDPRNRVAFALYFDSDDGVMNVHRLSTEDSPFPVARQRFRDLVSGGLRRDR